MFENKQKPQMNELIMWFQINFTELADAMKKSNHNIKNNEPNNYHIEDSVWTHTMMVCQRAEIENEKQYDKLSLITSLFHDIGKPMARTEEEIKILNEEDKQELKTICRFVGHEGISAYLSVEPLKELNKIGILTKKEMFSALKIISLHGVLFNNITEEGEMKKPEAIFEKFEDKEEFKSFVRQVKNDSLGRFYYKKGQRKNQAYKLGEEIYTEKQFLEYKNREKIIQNIHKAKKLRVLVGIPGIGKSTWIEKNKKGDVVISRDTKVLEYGKEKYGENLNYSEIFKKLTNKDHKEIDSQLLEDFQAAYKLKKNIIIDMTNTSKKARRKWVNTIPKEYKKEAIVFITSLKQIKQNLLKREKETGKWIPEEVIERMMKTFLIPTYEEFEEITYEELSYNNLKKKKILNKTQNNF